MHPSLSQWFREQLLATASSLVWTIEQVPTERHHQRPPRPDWLGEWTLARHVFHLSQYERTKALPYVLQSADLPIPPQSDEDEEMLWQRDGMRRDVKDMLAEFQQVRNELISILDRLDDAAWEAPIGKEAWGIVTLKWVMTKLYQHTYDHTNTLLQIVVF